MDLHTGCLTGILRVVSGSSWLSTDRGVTMFKDNYAVTPYAVFQIVDRNETVPYVLHHGEKTHGTWLSEGPKHTWGSVRTAQIQQLQHSIRAGQGLVWFKPDSRQLWLFGDRAAAAEPFQGTGASWKDENHVRWEVSELELRSVSSSTCCSQFLVDIDPCTEITTGVFESSRLRPTSKPPAKITTPISAPPVPSSFEQNSNASRLLHAKAFLANKAVSATTEPSTSLFTETDRSLASQELGDPIMIYGYLVSAIVSLISYRLASSLDYLPLNFQTLMTPRMRSDGSLDDTVTRPRSLVTIDVRITASGSILIVPFVTLWPHLMSLTAYGGSKELLDALPGSEVWLAPGGTIARFMGMVIVEETNLTQEDCSRDVGMVSGTSRMYPKAAEESTLRRWRSDVVTWLIRKGIRIDPKCHARWARVEIDSAGAGYAEASDDSQENSELGQGTVRTVLWPERLCFLRYPTHDSIPWLDLSSGGDQKDHADWLPHTAGNPFADSLGFIDDLYTRPKQRSRKPLSRTENRQLGEPADAHQTQNRVESSQSETDDVLYLAGSMPRSNNAGEILGLNGIYPTPPDGTQGLGATGTDSVDFQETISGTSRAAVESSSGLNANAATEAPKHVDLLTNTENPKITAVKREESDASMFDLESRDFAAERTAGIFDHRSDDDMFNEAGITEADFSFFDGPDLEVTGFLRDGNYTLNMTSKPDTSSSLGVIVETSAAQGLYDGEDLRSQTHGVTRSDLDSSKVADDLDQAEDEVLRTHQGRQSESPAIVVAGVPSRPNDLAVTKSADATPKHSAAQKFERQGMSPPMSPGVIMKKLLSPRVIQHDNWECVTETTIVHSSLDRAQEESEGVSLHNGFDPVRFGSGIDNAKDKYVADGRFSFPLHSMPENESPHVSSAVGRFQRVPRIGQSLPTKTASSEQAPAAGSSSQTSSPSESSGNQLATVFPLTHSADEENLGLNRDSQSIPFSPAKRKREWVGDEDCSEGSSLHSLTVEKCTETSERSLSVGVDLDLLDSSPFDWSLTGILSSNDDEGGQAFKLSGEEFIRTAQVITEQVTSGTLQPLLYRNVSDTTVDQGEAQRQICQEYNTRLVKGVVQEIFPAAFECDLTSYLTIEDASSSSSSEKRQSVSRMHPQAESLISDQKREMIPNENRGGYVTRSQQPHLQVQRGEESLEVLPSALEFWDSSGLGPCSGPKDVTFFCVYPEIDGIENSISRFLEVLGNTYETCNFGRHSRASAKFAAYDKGLVPVNINDPAQGMAGVKPLMESFKDTCVRLGRS